MRGIVSLTDEEITKLQNIYNSKVAGDEYTMTTYIVRQADKALLIAPCAVPSLITSGNTVATGEASTTSIGNKQSNAAYSLALGYAITGKQSYYDAALAIIKEWAAINNPVGDTVANASLLNMFRSYDLLGVADNDINAWLTATGNAIIVEQESSIARNSQVGINNHHSWGLLEICTLGHMLNNQLFQDYYQSRMDKHIADNLRSFPDEPLYFGVDFHERKAVHYVAFNMAALCNLMIIIEGRSTDVDNTFKALLPYASGEKQSMNEFEGSQNSNDDDRIANGSLSAVFDPIDALDAINAYYLYSPVVGGYNLASIATNIVIASGKKPVTAKYPTVDMFINYIRG
jgi:hypothetical protein